MKRTVLILGLATAFGLLTVGVGATWAMGQDTPTETPTATPEPVQDAPEKVNQTKPLAQAFYTNITAYYPDARVYITPEGRIALDISPKADSGDGVNREMRQIALRYSNTVNRTGYNATTLSIVTGNVEMVVPRPAVKAHSSGNLTDDAYQETIEIRSVDRGTDSN